MTNLTGRPVYTKLAARKREKPNDNSFLSWLRKQPSALSGRSPCDPCHYRTADNSGTACKPLYSAIPLTREEHLEQHRVGQFNFQPRDWWENQVLRHLQKWLRTL